MNLEPAPANLDAAAHLLPAGVYTAFRTFGIWQAYHLENHLDRLQESARLAGMPLHFDHARVRAAIRRAIQAFGEQEAKFRITFDLVQEPGTLYLSAEPLHAPSAEQYRSGVSVCTCSLRRHNPEAKLTDFSIAAAEMRKNLPSGVHEAVMVGDEGQILEGLSSNFYVVRQGEVWTAGEGVLHGITREFVLENGPRLGIPVHRTAPRLSEIGEWDEAFLTSSGRGVLAVVRLNDNLIGAGTPGPVTNRLRTAYEEHIQAEIQPI